MGLPAKPTVSTTATEATAPVVSETKTEVNAEVKADTAITLKRFGAARVGDGDDAKLAPTPTAAGVDLVELSKQLYNTVTNFTSSKGVKLEDVLAFAADADKSKFPGHKDGRVAYATAGIVASLGKMNGLLTKVRGVGGGAAMKAKLIEKDSKIADLEKKLAEIMARMGVQA